MEINKKYASAVVQFIEQLFLCYFQPLKNKEKTLKGIYLTLFFKKISLSLYSDLKLKAMKIYTGYFGKLRTYQEKGLFTVSIARGNFKYGTVNYKELRLCPTWAMLKRNYSEEEYKENILSKLNPEKLVNDLKIISRGKDIVLLCYEKDHKECHRSFVSDWLNDNGINVSEFGHVPKQGDLFR